MNPLKVLFVICVNNETLFEMCKNTINSLVIPPNYSIEILPIRGMNSIFSAYNQALTNDAKYKIYLHQDVFILEKHFIFHLLNLFLTYPHLGMIGMIGCVSFPQNGIWWESPQQIGKVWGRFNGQSVLMNVGEVMAPYQPVKAVDGLLLATQYDLQWRDDLFSGFHFYDISQSAEFIRHGYQVGVPKQASPWCNHFHKDNLNLTGYEENRQIFVEHYGTI